MQITNTEIVEYIAVLVFKLLNPFITRKDNINCLKVGYFF